jgi:hypothetical protein
MLKTKLLVPRRRRHIAYRAAKRRDSPSFQTIEGGAAPWARPAWGHVLGYFALMAA